MKLYVFASCPFCSRVRALINIKQIDCDLEFVQPGQLDSAISQQLSHFSVPVLALRKDRAVESPVCQAIQDSEKILAYLDQLRRPLLQCYQPTPAIQSWLLAQRQSFNRLCYPRMLALGLPELASKQSREYFVRSREQSLEQSFEQALAQTQVTIDKLSTALLELENLLDLSALANDRRKITIDDLAILAELRNLTMVAELHLPDKAQRYFARLLQQSRLDSFKPITANQALLRDN